MEMDRATYRSDGEDEEEDEVPLHHKRPFGTGLNTRKPIAFVPASSGDLNTTDDSTKATSSKNISDLYLSLVLPKESGSASPAPTTEICEVCKMPLADDPPREGRAASEPSSTRSSRKHHESSLAHQVCLAHSHPPSALDRSRMGLTYLEAYGWDPDARAGLGAAQQGIQFPIKPKAKEDTLGIGVVVPKNLPKKEKKPQKLDAGRVRKMAQEDKKRTARIQREFYGNSELQKYLGPGS